jgi:tetratricopeptide (TPR) repeat protein
LVLPKEAIEALIYAYEMKGFILSRLGKYEEALDCYNKADELIKTKGT